MEVSAGRDRHIDLFRSVVEGQYMVVLEVHFLVVVHCHLVLMEVSVDCLAVQDLLVLVQNPWNLPKVVVLSEVLFWLNHPDCKIQQ